MLVKITDKERAFKYSEAYKIKGNISKFRLCIKGLNFNSNIIKYLKYGNFKCGILDKTRSNIMGEKIYLYDKNLYVETYLGKKIIKKLNDDWGALVGNFLFDI